MGGPLSSLLFWGTLATSGVLVVAVWRWRWLLVKPSVIAVLFFHLTVQWGSVVLAPEILPLLPRPADFVLLLLGFPLLTVATTGFFFRRSARRLLRASVLTGLRPRGSTFVLLAVWGVILGIGLVYLTKVPPRSTGLYAVIFAPDNAAEAREHALALLPWAPLRYAVAILNSSLAPLAAVLSIAIAITTWRAGRQGLPWLIFLLGLPLLLLLVSLSGARAPAGMLLLHVVFAVFLLHGFPITPGRIGLAAGLVLLPPVVLSLWRNADSLSIASIAFHFADILDRVAVRAAQPAFWNVLYVQENGFFGPAAIPKLAALLGTAPVDQFNVVYLAYNPEGLESGTANTAASFALYGAFGLVALPLGVLLTVGADAVLPLLRLLSLRVRIPCLSVCCVAATQFAATSFSTVLVTHGFLVTLAIGIALDLWFRTLRRPSPRSLSCASAT